MSSSENISICKALEALEPVTLEEMDSIKLMNRIDTKYLTDEKKLLGFLADAAAAGYRVLVTRGMRISPYNSVYYDTPGLKMFTDHRNRHLTRQKVRTRVYENSGDTFLEIKRKNNKGRTKKKRMTIPGGELMDFRADTAATLFLEQKSAFTADMLSPVLSTRFRRITLVNPSLTERLTIDTHLEFHNFRSGKDANLKDTVIIELKQDGREESKTKKILLARRIKPVRVSKYCVAVTLTAPEARPGRFKMKIRKIEKIINSKIQSE